jgi:hypothetical protein
MGGTGGVTHTSKVTSEFFEIYRAQKRVITLNRRSNWHWAELKNSPVGQNLREASPSLGGPAPKVSGAPVGSVSRISGTSPWASETPSRSSGKPQAPLASPRSSRRSPGGCRCLGHHFGTCTDPISRQSQKRPCVQRAIWLEEATVERGAGEGTTDRWDLTTLCDLAHLRQNLPN